MRIRILRSMALAVLVSVTAPDTFAQQLLYIHADHLNTPQVITNAGALVPNIKSEFSRAIRMPITSTEQGTTSEAHDIGGNFVDGVDNLEQALGGFTPARTIRSFGSGGLDRPVEDVVGDVLDVRGQR